MKKVVIFLVLVAGLFQCDDVYEESPCTTLATVRDLNGLDGCGWVFELENGTQLEPLRFLFCGTPPLPKEVTEDPLYNFEFADGKRVFISYTETDSGSYCMVGPVVKITCLTEAEFIPVE